MVHNHLGLFLIVIMQFIITALSESTGFFYLFQSLRIEPKKGTFFKVCQK